METINNFRVYYRWNNEPKELTFHTINVAQEDVEYSALKQIQKVHPRVLYTDIIRIEPLN